MGEALDVGLQEELVESLFVQWARQKGPQVEGSRGTLPSMRKARVQGLLWKCTLNELKDLA